MRKHRLRETSPPRGRFGPWQTFGLAQGGSDPGRRGLFYLCYLITSAEAPTREVPHFTDEGGEAQGLGDTVYGAAVLTLPLTSAAS